MTNKLPVVGKRYRNKKFKANGILSGWYLNQVIPFGIFDFDDGRKIEVRGSDLENFFSEFEEVPVDNIKIQPNPVVDNKIETNNEVDKAYDKGWHDGVDFAIKILIEELKRK